MQGRIYGMAKWAPAQRPPHSRAVSPLVKAGLTYLMRIIIKIVNNNSISKQKYFVFIKIIVIFLFLLTENCNQQNESNICAKVYFTGPCKYF